MKASLNVAIDLKIGDLDRLLTVIYGGTIIYSFRLAAAGPGPGHLVLAIEPRLCPHLKKIRMDQVFPQ